jgi:hypothetical protein
MANIIEIKGEVPQQQQEQEKEHYTYFVWEASGNVEKVSEETAGITQDTGHWVTLFRSLPVGRLQMETVVFHTYLPTKEEADEDILVDIQTGEKQVNAAATDLLLSCLGRTDSGFLTVDLEVPVVEGSVMLRSSEKPESVDVLRKEIQKVVAARKSRQQSWLSMVAAAGNYFLTLYGTENLAASMTACIADNLFHSIPEIMEGSDPILPPHRMQGIRSYVDKFGIRRTFYAFIEKQMRLECAVDQFKDFYKRDRDYTLSYFELRFLAVIIGAASWGISPQSALITTARRSERLESVSASKHYEKLMQSVRDGSWKKNNPEFS